MASTFLANDARNRALRTFLVGIATDVGVALALVLYTVLGDANGWSDLDWTVLAFTVTKTIVTSAAAYVMRRFLDPSNFPTPLPPSDPGHPADPVPGDVI